MRKISTLLFLLAGMTSFAQNLDTNRYKESIFTSLLQSDIQYGSAPQWVWPYWDEDLFLDVFQPNGDLNSNRPLIIFAHAGGFVNGSKDVDNMHAICDTFARKGFVTTTIDYRKGFNPLDEESAERAVYRAVQDGKAAVRYFKENMSLYDIDTNNIFFGGMSAGGFVAYHVAYLDEESERPASTYGGGTVNDLGCADCAGNSFNHTSEVKAVLDYWGATIDTTFMQAGDVPIMIMHGTEDPTVPYNVGNPFGLTTLPTTYGALPISNQAEAVGVPYEMYINNMDIHMMGGSSNGTWSPAPNDFWGDTLLPFTENFIFDLIKPITSKISPDTVYLGLNEMYTFEVSNTAQSEYVWDFNSADILELTNNNEATLELQFITPGTYEVKTIEFNDLLAAGDEQTFVAIVSDDVSFDELLNVELNLFPNPASNIINVESSEWMLDLQLIDMTGKILRAETIESDFYQLDLSDLIPGFYFLNVNTESGTQTLKFSKL